MPNLKPSEILRAGLNLLETRGWTQGTYGRNTDGDSVNANQATCFCGIGAIRIVTFNEFVLDRRQLLDPSHRKARNLLDEVINIPGPFTLCFAKWQDEPKRTFAEVKAKFIEAIQLAEQQERGETL